jgi:hypothetical protein
MFAAMSERTLLCDGSASRGRVGAKGMVVLAREAAAFTGALVAGPQ